MSKELNKEELELQLRETIKSLDSKIEEDKKTLKQCKKSLVDAESQLIEDVETRKKVQEQLRLILLEKVPTELTWEEQEVARFAKVLPDLMKKIK
jgi:hypothetical protein